MQRLQVSAEKAAWELAKQHHLDLIAVNPSMLVGPVTGTRLGGSSLSVKVEAANPAATPVCLQSPTPIDLLMPGYSSRLKG